MLKRLSERKVRGGSSLARRANGIPPGSGIKENYKKVEN